MQPPLNILDNPTDNQAHSQAQNKAYSFNDSHVEGDYALGVSIDASIGSKTDAKTSHPNRLRDFQLAFGDYLRQQRLDILESNSDEDLEHNKADDANDNDIEATTKANTKIDTTNATNGHISNLENSKDNTEQSPVSLQIPKRAGQVYQELVFNNLTGFINQCFPVCQTLMSEEEWRALTLKFFQQGELHSPYFTEINQHFIDFLYSLHELDEEQQADRLLNLDIPTYLADLAHYEYVELLLDVQPDDDSQANYQNQPAYLQIYPGARLNTALQNLHYPWAVHCISADEPPSEATETFLLVYRTPEHQVEFMEVNAMTHLLIAFMSECLQAEHSSEEAMTLVKFTTKAEMLTAFFNNIGIQVEAQMINFGEQLLEQLESQQVVLITDER